MLWPRGNTDDLYAYYERCNRDSFHEPNERFLKVVDGETGTMLAGSQWAFNLDVEAEAKKEIIGLDEPPPADWPIDGNWSIRRSSKIEWATWKRLVFAGIPYLGIE